jgi:uncharacterized protein (TIGR02284 family)
MATAVDNKDVDQLNSFLRGELAAAETYRQALLKLPNSQNVGLYQDCARSHADRAALLTREVRRLGGEPSEDSGMWGTFAKAVEAGAQMFGEKTAIAALEEGEDHGKRDYLADLGDLSSETRSLVKAQILPEQMRTHGIMSTLKQLTA